MSGLNISDKVRIHYDSSTGEYGLQVKLTNKTGNNSVKGYLCTPSNGTANAFVDTPIDAPDIMCIVYEAGIADGSDCWVWLQGLVEIYFIGNTTLGHFARASATGDSGAAGQAVSEAAPSSPFSTDKHFQEVGHVVEARVGAGVAKCITHFN